MRTFVIAAVASATITLTGGAGAGYKLNASIELNKSAAGGNATGAMGTVRASSDDNQAIGCTYHGWYSVCTAHDSKSKMLSCYTEDPGLLEVVSHMPEDGYLSFAADADGDCIYVFWEKSSKYRPRSP